MEAVIALAAAVALGLRLYQIETPDHVCWDEVHFGKHASYYINRTFFFDVHPPLGKMILAVTGYYTGYEGDFSFHKPGDSMRDIQYVGMRQVSALFGSAVIPISAATVWEMSSSPVATILTTFLITADTAMTVISRFILLDSFLMFYISLACYFYIKHTNSGAFERSWWLYLCGCGISLSCAVGVKFVGLFVVAHIGLSVANDLWHVVCDKDVPLELVVQHVLARVYALICLPAFAYSIIYVLHFIGLNLSGPGDGFYSSGFQTTMINNPLYHVKMPEYVAFGSEITLKNYRTNGGYLHSHTQYYPKEVGPPLQQVTSYSHKDENNHWLIKSDSEEGKDSQETAYIKDGDLVRLQHKKTKMQLHSHDESAPLTRSHRQVGGEKIGKGNTNEIFKVKVIQGHQEEGKITPIFTVFQLIHVNEKCALECKGRQLPKWASEQKEVTCNPALSSSDSLWNIEELLDSRIPAVRLDWIYDRPGFLSKLAETHLVMFANNRNLKPKPDEFRSRPWMWPLAYRGQLFSTEPHILMLGNPVTHWMIIVLLCPAILLFAVDMVKYQRAKAYNTQERALSSESQAAYRQMGWLVLAWSLHFLPFWPMTRILYPHHYLPAYVFSSMFTGVSVNHMIQRLSNKLGPILSIASKYLTVVVICASSAGSFYALSPIVYGYDSSLEPNPMSNYKFSDYWDF